MIKGCPACEWARKRGELRQFTADGCPICDAESGNPADIIDEIDVAIDAIPADDDRTILRVALSDLIAALP
jgi:hypothetical protein